MALPVETIGPFIVDTWLDGKSTGIGHHIDTLEEVFIKTERANLDLPAEACALQSLSGSIGIPAIHWFGTAFGQRTMVTDMHGPSLESMFDECGRYFDTAMLLEFANQLIFRLESMHSQQISHGNLDLSCFSIGSAPWQSPQIVLTGLGSGNFSLFDARKDLEAVGDILLHLATGSQSRDELQGLARHSFELPSFLRIYFEFIWGTEINPADYVVLRHHLHVARQGLSKRTLFGGSDSLGEEQSSLKFMAGKNTGDLFDTLGTTMSIVGQLGEKTKSWKNDEAASIIQRLDEIMSIFMVLLMRDKPSRKRQKYLMGAHHLPNRLWRDLRWYIRMAAHGSTSLQRLVNLRIYRFLGALIEIIPVYNRYWTAHLSEVAYCLMNLDSEASISWRRAWIYWKDCANLLSRRK
ncbi:unnamed protein product [Penicillium manginii]